MCLYGSGFIWKYDQREGLTCKRAKGGGALYRIEERGRGFFGKVAILFLLPPPETGEWGNGSGGGRFRRPGPRGRSGCGVKEAGGAGVRSPAAARPEAA